MIKISSKLVLSNLGGIFMSNEKHAIVPLSAKFPLGKGRKGNMILLSIKRDDYKLDLYTTMDLKFIKEILRDLL